jgi:hypothetical protein
MMIRYYEVGRLGGFSRWQDEDAQFAGMKFLGDEPPDECPVCGAPKSAFVKIEGQSKKTSKLSDTP